ncbi:MAG: hypothetical protein AB1726_00945 [Planctomycetota bacterium]
MRMHLSPPGTRSRNPRSGTGLVLVLVILTLLVLGGPATALVSMTGSGYLEQRQSRDEMRAFYVAEAGLNEALAMLRENGIDSLAAYADPVPYGQGTFAVAVTDGVDDPVLRFDRISLDSVGTEGRESSRVLLIARRVPNGTNLHGIFGADGVSVESNAYLDSFHSMYGPYDPDAGNVSEYCSVGSNSDITIAANVEIHGDVTPGPGGILDDDAPQTLITGSTEPAEELVDMPAIDVPVIASTGSRTIGAPAVFAPGDYHLDSLTINGGGALLVRGPARLVLDSVTVNSNSSLVVDATGGPVEIYATGDFDLRSNSVFRSLSDRARDVALFITTDTSLPGTTVALNSNSDFVGTIYAPSASLTIESNFRIFGAVKADSVVVASNAQVHFDEDLLFDDFDGAEIERVSWRFVSTSQEL